MPLDQSSFFHEFYSFFVIGHVFCNKRIKVALMPRMTYMTQLVQYDVIYNAYVFLGKTTAYFYNTRIHLASAEIRTCRRDCDLACIKSRRLLPLIEQRFKQRRYRFFVKTEKSFFSFFSEAGKNPVTESRTRPEKAKIPATEAKES